MSALHMVSVDIERIWILPLVLISLIIIFGVIVLKKNILIFNIEGKKGNRRVSLYHSIMIWLSYVCLFSAYIFIGLASAGVSLLYTDNTLVRGGNDILLLVDVSPSMSVEDIDEQSRWEAVKYSIHSVLDEASRNNIGVVFFSNSISFSVPFTKDYEYITSRFDTIHLGILGNDTALADALAFAYQVYRNRNTKNMNIIVMTDGNQNTGAVSLSEVQPFLSTIASRISFINIGKNEPARFTYNDRETKQIISGTLLPIKNNFIVDYIKNIGIPYYTVESKQALRSILSQIINNTAEQQYLTPHNIREDKTPYILLFALISFLCFFMIRVVFLKVLR